MTNFIHYKLIKIHCQIIILIYKQNFIFSLLMDALTWKYLGTFNSGETYDSVAHNIPTDAKEMTFTFKYGILELVVYANVDDMKATTATHDYPLILNGWYSTSTNNGSGGIQHSSSKFGISNFTFVGVNTIAPCTVYYR